MGDRGEHMCAFADEVLDLRLHGVEGDNGLADLLGAFDVDRWRLQVVTEAPCGIGEALQRVGQLAGGEPGDQQSGDQSQGDDHGDTRARVQAPAAFGGVKDNQLPSASCINAM